MRSIRSKKGALLQKYTIHIILFALVLALFMYATYKKSDSSYVKQQIIEKQIALLIDSAYPGMDFYIENQHIDGVINDIKITNGRVYVTIDGFASLSGYRYFSKHLVSVDEVTNQFVIKVRDQ
jgi:hypothetical protein